MTATRISKSLVVSLLLFGLFAADIAAAAPFQRMVVFGDSLSDPGNAFVLLGRAETPPFPLIPDAPYARGGLHFSNGQTWVEDLAGALGLNASSGPALRVPDVYSNYAVGGARARPGQPFDLGTQVDLFLGHSNGTAPQDALYVVFIGSNDVRDAINALATDSSGVTSVNIINAALSALRDNITTLASAGARNFLVANVPNLKLVPAVRMQPPLVQDAAEFLSASFNSGLDATLAGLQVALSGVSFTRLDVFSILNQVVTDPATVGLSDVQDSCITPDTTVQPFCAQPDRYLFWDGIHPTSVGHAILARDARTALGL